VIGKAAAEADAAGTVAVPLRVTTDGRCTDCGVAALADSTAETKGGAGKASLDLVALRAGREGSLVNAADRSTVGNVTVSIAAG